MPFLLCSELSFSCSQTITNVWQWWGNTSSSYCGWQSGTVMAKVPSRQSTQQGHGHENLPARPRLQTVKWLGVPGAGHGHCSVVSLGLAQVKGTTHLRSDSRCWARDEYLTSPSTELLFSRSSYQLALRFPNQCFVPFFKVRHPLCIHH